MKFRWSFFDCVFELVRVERYEKIMNPNKKPATNVRQSMGKGLLIKIENESVRGDGKSPERDI